MPAGVDSEAPTVLVSPSTDPGKVMGTVGYVSPEQVQGQEADHRADLFAVGVILYEMLAGRRAFEGASAAAVISAILRDEPAELTESNDKVPPQLERIVRRCLEKKLGQRFQSASDLGFALEALATPSGSRLETSAALPASETIRTIARRGGREKRWIVATTLAVLTAPGLAWAYITRQPVADARVFKTSIDLWLCDASGENAERFTFDPGSDFAPVWSPDGSRIVWTSTREGSANLYQKAASGAGQDTLLLKSEFGSRTTDWSRDGRFIIYTKADPKTHDDVWVLPMAGAGGQPSGEQKPFPVLQTQANETWATLSPDGWWLAYASDESGRFEVYVQSFSRGGGVYPRSSAVSFFSFNGVGSHA